MFSQIAAFLISVNLWAASNDVNMKQFIDTKNSFKLEYPINWSVQPPDKAESSPILVTLKKSDHTVMVSVMLAKQESKLKAIDFMNQMDQSRKATNLISEKERQASADSLKKSQADEGAKGSYEIPGATPVLQKSLTLKRGTKVFVLTGTFQKARQTEDEKIVDSVLASFQFTK